MRNTYTQEAIKETPTYKELESKGETTKCKFLLQKGERERISNAVQVFKNTGSIPNTVSGIYLSVVKDIINEAKNIEVDYSTVMTAEKIHLKDE